MNVYMYLCIKVGSYLFTYLYQSVHIYQSIYEVVSKEGHDDSLDLFLKMLQK